MAVPSIPVLAPGHQWMGMGVGNFSGQSAVGIAYGYQLTEHWNAGVAVSSGATDGSHLAAKAQIGYGW